MIDNPELSGEAYTSPLFTGITPTRPRIARVFCFQVVGVPQTQGSSKSFGFHLKDGAGKVIYGRNGQPIIRTVTTSDNPNMKQWRQLVASAAGEVATGEVLLGAIRLTLEFLLPRPKSTPRRVVHHLTRPDCSKLIRSVEDALTSVLWRDDSQVVELVARKAYGAPVGVTVTVEELA